MCVDFESTVLKVAVITFVLPQLSGHAESRRTQFLAPFYSVWCLRPIGCIKHNFNAVFSAITVSDGAILALSLKSKEQCFLVYIITQSSVIWDRDHDAFPFP